MTTQASFIAYDMLDRIRANPVADYAGQSAGAGLHSVLGQDLSDFKRNVRQFGGASAKGSIAINEREVAITLEWDDRRAGESLQTFTLTSQISSGFAVGAS